MKKFSVFLSLFAIVFVLTTNIIPAVSTESAKAVTNSSSTRQEELSTGELAKLTAISAFSPGISLLRVASIAQKKGANFNGNVWFIIWLIAGFYFVIDKIPGLATFHQFLAHAIIWGTAFLGSTYLGGDTSMWIGFASGSFVQFVRQAYTVPTDVTIVGAPARSLIEDILAFLMLPFP